jgi:hypothetical protein
VHTLAAAMLKMTIRFIARPGAQLSHDTTNAGPLFSDTVPGLASRFSSAGSSLAGSFIPSEAR